MFSDLAIFTTLKTKMQWHQSRQQVLAENIANADTPGYMARDLRKPDFDAMVERVRTDAVAVGRTNARHFAGGQIGPDRKFRETEKPDWEITPSGNGVVLEEQMMKMTANQMEYQSAASLYAKSVSLLKIALGTG